MARCWMTNIADGKGCTGEAIYTIEGVPICVDCARKAEAGLRDGTLKYRGRTPARGEVAIRSAEAAGGGDSDSSDEIGG